MNQAQIKALGLNGRELDAALSEALGIPPLRAGLRCEDETGHVWGQFDSREDAREYHQANTRQFGRYANLAGRITDETVWKNVSGSWDLMGLVVRQMTERGWWLVLKSPFDEKDNYSAGFTPLGTSGWNGRPDYKARASDAPEAVARAALLALREEGAKDE